MSIVEGSNATRKMVRATVYQAKLFHRKGVSIITEKIISIQFAIILFVEFVETVHIRRLNIAFDAQNPIENHLKNLRSFGDKSTPQLSFFFEHSTQIPSFFAE